MKTTLTSMAVASLLILPGMLHSAPTDETCTTCTGESCALGDEGGATTQPAAVANKWTAYGEPTKMTDADNVDAGKVLSDVKSFDGKTVRITGVVSSVCQKKGCWMKMTSGTSTLNVFVHFSCPIEGRLIPIDAVGKPAVVEGKLAVTKLSEKDAKHIAEEEGQSKEQVALIKGEQMQIEVDGPSALIATK